MSFLAGSRSLRALVAVATVLWPLARVKAETSVVDRLTPQSVAAVTVRLADLAASPVMENYPVEVLAAATDDFLGLPLESIERVTLVFDPPVGATPQFAVFLESTEKISFDNFRGEILDEVTPSELLGRPALIPPADGPVAPWICLMDDNTLAVGPKLYLKRFLRGADGSQTELADAMRAEGAEQNHLHAAVMLKPLRPFVELGLMAAKQDPEFPPEGHKYLDGLLLLNRVVLAADFSGARESSFVVYADDRDAADRVEGLLAEGIALIRSKLNADGEMQKLRDHEEPVARAAAAYVDRMVGKYAEAAESLRDDETRFTLLRVEEGEGFSQFWTTYYVGVMVALLLPAVQAAREAARRNASINNMRQIVLAWHNYHDVHGSFPPQAICADDGTPLLSWRVAILPYMEEQALYNKFRLDEPWDSPHNLPLVAEMPASLFDPSSPGLETTDGKTHYLGVVGVDAALSGEEDGRPIREFTDGTANTLLTVQVDDAHATPWTKPADFRISAHGANPIGGIGTIHPGGFIAGFADGHTRFVQEATDPEVLRALMTVNGGEVAELP